MRAALHGRQLQIHTVDGRPLFRDLSLSLHAGERVAVVGRNGVGKSTLLRVLGGEQPTAGEVRRQGRVVHVQQDLPTSLPLERARVLQRDKAWSRGASALGLPSLDHLATGASRGEQRKLLLLCAFVEEPDVLLLDEPTEDLDDAGCAWLADAMARFRGALVVVSHDPALLEGFEDFFVVAEAGCRHVGGGFSAVFEALEDEEEARQARYARTLNQLVASEARDERIRRRRARKKAFGRLNELGRATSKMRLNKKRGQAQRSQARVAGMQESRIGAIRQWARSTRRALSVRLPLDVVMPTLPEESTDVVRWREVWVSVQGEPVVGPTDLHLGRARIGLVGPNGAGKTTVLSVLMGQRRPDGGQAWVDAARMGTVSQGATEWRRDESLLGTLARLVGTDAAAEVLVAHRFPLPLAERSLRSLSPGERTRAALIALCHQPGIEVLVLDEPTRSLDLLGAAALVGVLRAWRGGLVVASHDRSFLDAVGIETLWELGTSGSSYRVAGSS